MVTTRSQIALTGRERFFAEDEIIVSKTDVTGKILYANRVFMNVSEYTEDELLGAPHSLLRHPDMPRAVFKFLWERLLAGHEVFAYVNNMARSGDNYWVLAHMTPTLAGDGKIIGFHSNRRVPDRSKIALVEPVYAAVLAEERRHTDRVVGLRASYDLLISTLRSTGRSYDEWVWTL